MLATTAALLWPLPLQLATSRPEAGFWDSYVWCLDHQAAMLLGERPWSLTTDRLGFPSAPEVRFVAWVPAVLAAPFRALWGPIAAANLTWLWSPALAALAAFLFYRRLAGTGDWKAAGASIAYALAPVALGCLASGQLSKLQHWILPLWGWGLLRASESRLPAAALFGLGTLAMALTSPVQAMFLPFVGVLLLPNVRRTVTFGASVLLAGVALLVARHYFGALDDSHSFQAFIPANVDANQVFGPPSTVAQPAELFLGTDDRQAHVPNPKHVAYLGIPAVLALLAGGRLFAWGATAIGVLLALGPELASGNRFLGVPLPARLLAMADYPLSTSGMYYRAMFVAWLGVGAAVAGMRFRPALAWVAGIVLAADAIRATRPLWPRPVLEIEGAPLLAEMAADPLAGAVLSLPIAHNPRQAGITMLEAVVHGRPIIATARHGTPNELPNLRHALDALQGAVASATPREAHGVLRDAGFRYVLARRRDKAEVTMEALAQALGRPKVDGAIALWTVDPDAAATEPLAPVGEGWDKPRGRPRHPGGGKKRRQISG